MSLHSFLHNLHFDVENANQPNWEVDWEDAPLTYKLYKDLPTIPLSLNVPLTLEEQDVKTKPYLSKIGHFLWYVYGITQICQSAIPSGSIETVRLMQSNRRYVPSGGALYPNELYVYLNNDEYTSGVYHYDAARHCLVLLRKGNFDLFISRALGYRCDVSNCFSVVFVSTVFWKNFFKYNNFAYRLQGLDTGVLNGQILEMAKRFGFHTSVYFQFIDRAINKLLGLSDEEESVYSVIPLLVEDAYSISNEESNESSVTTTELCKELPVVQHKKFCKSKKILEYPMLIKMNEESMMDSSQMFRHLEGKESMNPPKQILKLPKVSRLSYDLAQVSRKRFSPDMDFVSHKVSLVQLATLLYEATSSFFYRNDLDEPQMKSRERPSMFCCLYNIENIPDGAYEYDYSTHSLRLARLGDHRPQLQSGMTGTNVNLFQVPICLHVVGDKDYYKPTLGYRGYRIQQMEAGMMVQRLLLTASAMGLGGHPLLGYDVKLCDEIYQLNSEQKTCLIQIPIGYYRDRPCLQGGLYS